MTGAGPAWGRIVLAALVVGALAALWRFTPLSELVAPERVHLWARAVRETPWAPAALILLYTPAAFLMFPRPVLTLVAVLAFGSRLGFAYAIIGILLSALAAYYAGRLVPRAALERIAGRYVQPVKRAVRQHGLLAVFVLRVVPTAPHAVVSALAGALEVKLWHFAFGTFLGMVPGVLAATLFGAEMARALEDGSKANYWLAGGVVLVFAITAWMVRRWATRRAA